jgi:ribosome-binding factor A
MSNKTPSHAKGPTQRMLRVGEMIRRTLSDILMRGAVHDPDLNAMSITVGEVAVSPDLRVATIYVMPLSGTASADQAIAALVRHKGILRKMIADAMVLRFAPELRFRPDETFDRLDQARRLFSDPVVQRDIAAPPDTEA